MKKLFLDFLSNSNNDLYQKFMDNLENQRGIDFESYYNSQVVFENLTKYQELLACAFTWNETPEGRDFWVESCRRWEHYSLMVN